MQSNAVSQSLEIIICWGSLLIGLVACLVVMWLLMRAVRKGTLGRFLATVIQGGGIIVLGIVPAIIATAATWVARLGGMTLFSREGGNDGMLVGVGVIGLIVALGAAVLFAAIMIVQALTGWGSSE